MLLNTKPESVPPADSKRTIPRTCQTYTEAYLNVTGTISTQFYIVLYILCGVLAILIQLELSLHYRTCLNVFSFKAFLFSLLLFSVGSIISLLRHLMFTIWEPTYPSDIAEFLSVSTCTDSLIVLIAHISTSLVIICSYLSWIMNEKYTSSFLLQPLKPYLGIRQLNQEKIFVYLYGIILAFNYTVQYLLNRTFVVKINNVQQPFHYEIKNSIATALCRPAKKAIFSFGCTYVIFAICGRFIYYFVALIFGSFYRVWDSPIVGISWIDIHFFLRLIVAGILTIATFDITNRLYDVAYSYTLPFTDSYVNQFECLILGLSEKKHDTIKAIAFSELALLSNKRPDKLKELFKTTGNELKESNWYKIMTQCLLVIEDLCSKIDIEYNGVQPIITPTPIENPVEEAHRLNFSNKPIFTTVKKKQSYYDDRTSSTLSALSEIPELVENISGPLLQSRIDWLRNRIVDWIKSLEIRFKSSGILKSFYSDTVLRRMQIVLDRYQLVIWAAQSLGSLITSSLKEDTNGFVQKDMDNVLNCLLRCLVDIEKYVQEPPVAYKKLLDKKVFSGEAEAVILALKEAIYQITIKFSMYTDNFIVDTRYYDKWQNFLNFQE